MADQTFARRLARKSPEWTRQIARQAFSRRRDAIGAGTGVGVFFYLAGTMLAGIFTIGVFFGLGFYSLDHQTGENRINRTVRVSTQEETPASAEASVLEKAEQQGGKHFEPTRFGNASSDIVTGPVVDAPDAMTWVVANNILRLWGVRPGPQNPTPSLVSFVEWVRAKGPLECRKHAHSSRYRCSTGTGEDVAEAALLAGVGRAAEGATVAYRDAEARARRKGKGLWAGL